MQTKVWPQPPSDIGSLEPGWTRLGDLFADEQAIEGLLQYQGSFSDDLDRKGQAAYHITEYSNLFAIVAAVPFVGFGIVPDFSPANCAISFDIRPLKLDDRVVPARHPRFRFLDPQCIAMDAQREKGTPFSQALCEALRQGVEDHFTLLINQLFVRTKLSKSALWRLVGDSLAGRFLDAGRHFDRLAEAKVAAMAILKQPGSPLNNRQLHYFDISVRDEADPDQVLLSHTFRARGGCCRFYTVEGGHLCSTCVLQKPAERDQMLEAGLRQHFGLVAKPRPTVVNADKAG